MELSNTMFFIFTLTITAGASFTALLVVIKQIKNIPKEYFSKICEKQKDLKNYDKSVCQNTANDNIKKNQFDEGF